MVIYGGGVHKHVRMFTEILAQLQKLIPDWHPRNRKWFLFYYIYIYAIDFYLFLQPIFCNTQIEHP